MNNDCGSSNQPLKSRSTLFFERYAKAENENIVMRYIVGLLAGLLVIVLTAFVYAATRPRSVYYIPGAVSSGLALADRVPLISVQSFAVAWLMGWMNYTPDSIEGVYTRSLKFMAPGLLSRVHAQSVEELEKVRRDRLSSVFMLTAEPRVEENQGVFKIYFQGKRGIYMGKEEMSVDAARYVVSVLRSVVSDDNPYGLSVGDITKEEVLSEKE